MARIEIIEVRGVIQTGGQPGAGTVTPETLSPETLALVSGGAGGDVNIPDGADITQGAKADAAWDGSASAPTQQSILKRIAGLLAALGAVGDAAWSSGNGTLVGILKAIAGTNSTVAGSVATSRMNVRLQRDVAAPTAVSIASGAQDSTAMDISAWIAGGFLLPAGFEGTSVTYKVSHTTSGHVELRDQYGAVVTTPVVPSTAYPIPAEAAGFNSLVIRAGSTQTAARTINWNRKG